LPTDRPTTFDPSAAHFAEAQDAWGKAVAFLRSTLGMTLTPGTLRVPSPASQERGARR
jgi:hypothetical protein